MNTFSAVLDSLKTGHIAYRERWEKLDNLKFLYIENNVLKLHIFDGDSVYWSANQEDILAEDWIITDFEE